MTRVEVNEAAKLGGKGGKDGGEILRLGEKRDDPALSFGKNTVNRERDARPEDLGEIRQRLELIGAGVVGRRFSSASADRKPRTSLACCWGVRAARTRDQAVWIEVGRGAPLVWADAWPAATIIAINRAGREALSVMPGRMKPSASFAARRCAISVKPPSQTGTGRRGRGRIPARSMRCQLP